MMARVRYIISRFFLKFHSNYRGVASVFLDHCNIFSYSMQDTGLMQEQLSKKNTSKRYNLTILCIQSCQNLIKIKIPLEFRLVVFLNPLPKYGFLSITGYRISNVNSSQNFVRWTQFEKLTKPIKKLKLFREIAVV